MLKPTPKFYLRASLTLGILLWLTKTLPDIQISADAPSAGMKGISENVSFTLEAFSFIAFIFYYRLRFNKIERNDFVNLIWRALAIGLVSFAVSFIIGLFNDSIVDAKLSELAYLGQLLFNIEELIINLFLISTFTVWKKLILYQKSRRLLIWWKVFEASVFVSIFSYLTGLVLQESLFFQVFYGIMTLMALLLSTNLKWVAYLNFKQKWKGILFIFLITFLLFLCFSNLYMAPTDNQIFANISNLFTITLFTFLTFYGIFSLLVIFFNLPTSSVFEKKMEEAINFQRLSQPIQPGENEHQIFDVLLKSAMNTVYADAGWIEILRAPDECELRARNINRANIGKIRGQIAQGKPKSIFKSPQGKANDSEQSLVILHKSAYKSVLIVPIEIKGEISGYLYLLHELSDGFNKEMINVINTFVSQASISLENFRLMGEALENERYKEELNIAKQVQRALLPRQLEHDERFEIHGFTQAAQEVGGDYYDTFRLGEHRFAVVIGDVSGKGTSAAFHMSQMKGIFQSLAQLGLPAKDFLIKANAALSNCLEKSSFITLSYFIINTEKRSLEFARAGHCPTLYYSKKENQSKFFENKGLGLGILRNEHYADYVHVKRIPFEKGDIAVLYTDGISEAANEEKEEFGDDRLRKLLDQNSHYAPAIIQKEIISNLYEFCGHKDLNDDYTLVVIKFV